ALAQSFLDAGQSVQRGFQVILDLPGERPRMGVSFDELKVFQGMTVLLVDEASAGDTFRSNMILPTINLFSHKDDLQQGDRLLVSDGQTELRVLDILPAGILVEAVRAEALLSP